MEELKILIEALAEMPTLAIWVVAMYFFFKIAIVGSIFGVFRMAILKTHDYFKTQKESKLVKIETIRDVIEVKQVNFGKDYISDVTKDGYALFKEIHDTIRRNDGYKYIHKSDLEKLRKIWEANRGVFDEQK